MLVLWTDALAKGGALEESERRLLYVAIAGTIVYVRIPTPSGSDAPSTPNPK